MGWDGEERGRSGPPRLAAGGCRRVERAWEATATGTWHLGFAGGAGGACLVGLAGRESRALRKNGSLRFVAKTWPAGLQGAAGAPGGPRRAGGEGVRFWGQARCRWLGTLGKEHGVVGGRARDKRGLMQGAAARGRGGGRHGLWRGPWCAREGREQTEKIGRCWKSVWDARARRRWRGLGLGRLDLT